MIAHHGGYNTYALKGWPGVLLGGAEAWSLTGNDLDHGRELRSGWEGTEPSRTGKINRRHMVKNESMYWEPGGRGEGTDKSWCPEETSQALWHGNELWVMEIIFRAWIEPPTVWNRWTFKQISSAIISCISDHKKKCMPLCVCVCLWP